MDIQDVKRLNGVLQEIDAIMNTVVTQSSHNGSMGESYVRFVVTRQDGKIVPVDYSRDHRSNYAYSEPDEFTGSQSIQSALDELAVLQSLEALMAGDRPDRPDVFTVTKEWLNNWESQTYEKGTLSFTCTRFELIAGNYEHLIEYTDGSTDHLKVTLGDECSVDRQTTYPDSDADEIEETIKIFGHEYNEHIVGYVIKTDRGDINAKLQMCDSDHPESYYAVEFDCEGNNTTKQLTDTEHDAIIGYIYSNPEMDALEKAYATAMQNGSTLKEKCSPIHKWEIEEAAEFVEEEDESMTIS